VIDVAYSSQVDELWDSMCQSAITLISNALHNVDNDEKLLKVKSRISLFIQTMDVRFPKCIAISLRD
jgi:hypothetical protein